MKTMTGMRSMTVKQVAFASVMLGVMWLAGPANAVPVVDAWQFNLSSANGPETNGGGNVTGAGNVNNVDHLELTGNSTITQFFNNGSPVGGSFTDSGYLQIPGYKAEPGNGPQLGLPTGTSSISGQSNLLYIKFDNLTGTFGAGNTISFTAHAGTIGLWLDDDTDFNPATGHSKLLATFDIIDPSGGSNINFFGGAGGNAHVDITLQQSSGIAGLFADSNGNPFSTTLTLDLVDVDALLDPNFNPNPNFSPAGCNPPGAPNENCTSALLHVQNAGQFNIAAVPEPGTLALVGSALLGWAGLRRRKARK